MTYTLHKSMERLIAALVRHPEDDIKNFKLTIKEKPEKIIYYRIDNKTITDSAHKEAIIKSLLKWQEVSNIRFLPCNKPTQTPVINFKFGGYKKKIGGTCTGNVLNDEQIYITIYNIPGKSFDPVHVKFQVLLHEIGHALGLAHPGHYEHQKVFFPHDYNHYTVLSYNHMSPLDVTNKNQYRPASPMQADILAVQYLHGKKEIKSGSRSFRFREDQLHFETLHAPNGENHIDLSDHTVSCKIDLRPGAFSSIGFYRQHLNAFGMTKTMIIRQKNNVALSMESKMGSAYSGSGDDILISNKYDNILFSGKGDDMLVGSPGEDILSGGEGIDIYHFPNQFGNTIIKDNDHGFIVLSHDKSDIRISHTTHYVLLTTPTGTLKVSPATLSKLYFYLNEKLYWLQQDKGRNLVWQYHTKTSLPASESIKTYIDTISKKINNHMVIRHTSNIKSEKRVHIIARQPFLPPNIVSDITHFNIQHAKGNSKLYLGSIHLSSTKKHHFPITILKSLSVERHDHEIADDNEFLIEYWQKNKKAQTNKLYIKFADLRDEPDFYVKNINLPDNYKSYNRFIQLGECINIMPAKIGKIAQIEITDHQLTNLKPWKMPHISDITPHIVYDSQAGRPVTNIPITDFHKPYIHVPDYRPKKMSKQKFSVRVKFKDTDQWSESQSFHVSFPKAPNKVPNIIIPKHILEWDKKQFSFWQATYLDPKEWQQKEKLEFKIWTRHTENSHNSLYLFNNPLDHNTQYYLSLNEFHNLKMKLNPGTYHEVFCQTRYENSKEWSKLEKYQILGKSKLK